MARGAELRKTGFPDSLSSPHGTRPRPPGGAAQFPAPACQTSRKTDMY